MRFHAPAYRAHTPKWAHAPTSGDGAAARGGRFNPKGMKALYLAKTLQTMFIETNQDRTSGLFHPLTFCSYRVDCEDIFDLTASETRRALNITMSDLSCPWLVMSMKGYEPPSWSIARRLHDEESAAGILVPSFAPGATEADVNLVLWKYGTERPHLVEVYDPERRLPQNQLSFAES